jgi:hypothetical protein
MENWRWLNNLYRWRYTETLIRIGKRVGRGILAAILRIL